VHIRVPCLLWAVLDRIGASWRLSEDYPGYMLDLSLGRLYEAEVRESRDRVQESGLLHLLPWHSCSAHSRSRCDEILLLLYMPIGGGMTPFLLNSLPLRGRPPLRDAVLLGIILL